MEHPAETLATDNLRLRRWRAGDADTVDRAVVESREHLIPWMPWAAAHDHAAAVEYVTRCEQDWVSGAAYNYAVEVAGEAVGSISLMRRIGPGGLEIGYWIRAGWTGRGLGRSAAATLVREAFTLPGTAYVEIHHDAANHASGAIPRALGFTEVARKRVPEEPRSPGETGLLVVWRLTREDYLTQRQPTRTTATDSGAR